MTLDDFVVVVCLALLIFCGVGCWYTNGGYHYYLNQRRKKCYAKHRSKGRRAYAFGDSGGAVCIGHVPVAVHLSTLVRSAIARIKKMPPPVVRTRKAAQMKNHHNQNNQFWRKSQYDQHENC